MESKNTKQKRCPKQQCSGRASLGKEFMQHPLWISCGRWRIGRLGCGKVWGEKGRHDKRRHATNLKNHAPLFKRDEENDQAGKGAPKRHAHVCRSDAGVKPSRAA